MLVPNKVVFDLELLNLNPLMQVVLSSPTLGVSATLHFMNLFFGKWGVYLC